MRVNTVLFVIVSLLLASACQKTSTEYNLLEDRLKITVENGELSIIPLSDGAVRIRLDSGTVEDEKELILVNKQPTPAFQFSDQDGKLQLKTEVMTVTFDKKSAALEFSDRNGKVFLQEQPGSRKMISDSVMGEKCFAVEQRFSTAPDEFLFGLGQFQDGHYNLRNVTRKLIQVNSQIAIPFLYSSKGYGILWHQYGLTYFNPADNIVTLTKEEGSTDENKEVEVTTTAGTQKVSRRQSLYTGTFTVEQDGEYSVMLDLGNMENRHLLVIDDTAVIDQTNLWLPPAASTLVQLKAGEHRVQVVCNATNTPTLSWKKTGNTTTFRSPHARALDYVVFHGDNTDEIINRYRALSGQAPMLPLWAYGYWQCRERYTNSIELVQAVKEFRKRQLPVDVIVQDWQYWSSDSWGVPKLDESRYPNPSAFIRELHELNARFAISIWSNPDKNSEIGKAYVEKGLYIPDTKWLDYFNPETSETYWNTLNDNLFQHGVDAWWMDATEPENDALTGTMTHQGPGDFYRLTYPMFVSQSVFEGQRKVNPEKRVTILTRSAFAGQQRYGTINWSGDIAGTWDGFKRQLVAGHNYTLTGMPYWTTDIGGFFRPGPAQYADKKFHELLIRWFQWGAFSTIFRMHGYQTETEPWKYGPEVEANMRKMLNLRYRLMPYIYAEAWKIASNGSTMMRPMVMDFQQDPKAVEQAYQYMFGQSLLVAPVTTPGVTEVPVYLPKSTGWYDFWTGEKVDGGQTIQVSAPLDQIPLFVRAGSILPVGKVIQHTQQQFMDTLEIRVYTGADARFELYSDEGDTYHYEQGQYSIVPFEWSEQEQTLTIRKAEGEYKPASSRVFQLVWIDQASPLGVHAVAEKTTVVYDGEEMKMKKE